MKNHYPIPLFAILALALTAPFSNAQAQQPSEEQLAQMLKRFPEADTDKDGKLIALDCVNAVKDYVQGRAHVLSGAVLNPTQLADASTMLKDVT